ncbi:nucleotidyltransferase family protein [Rhodococcus globerulus]|uniref:nucleotidyltransferase family protein n=1 Tax=Rhodococcus globerulus TaxID=33008 RepID=UPI003015C9A5
MTPCGILLAAGGGSRMGTPKALKFDADGRSWLRRGVSTLRDAGCSPVIVVLGARAADAAALLPPEFTDTLVVESDWQKGMSESLRSGLEVAQNLDAVAAAITLVDLPDLDTATITRVIGPTVQSDDLRRAVFHGTPGHPVVIGRDHWRALIASLAGDSGANAYLRAHHADHVECSDLSTGRDVDYPQA